jgi:hypothetical protein
MVAKLIGSFSFVSILEYHVELLDMFLRINYFIMKYFLRRVDQIITLNFIAITHVQLPLDTPNFETK